MFYAHNMSSTRKRYTAHTPRLVRKLQTTEDQKTRALLMEVAIMSDLANIWQARARESYTQAAPAVAAGLRVELSTRVRALTGKAVNANAVYADPGKHEATATVDGITFRLERDKLVLVRHCGYCGSGEFESTPIEDVRDLGYALSAWDPRHADCEEADPAEYLYNYDF